MKKLEVQPKRYVVSVTHTLSVITKRERTAVKRLVELSNQLDKLAQKSKLARLESCSWNGMRVEELQED